MNIPVYMNAPDCEDIFVIGLTGSVAALYPALVQPDELRASKKSAGPCLIRNASLSLSQGFRLGGPRSYLVCLRTTVPTQPFECSVWEMRLVRRLMSVGR